MIAVLFSFVDMNALTRAIGEGKQKDLLISDFFEVEAEITFPAQVWRILRVQSACDPKNNESILHCIILTLTFDPSMMRRRHEMTPKFIRRESSGQLWVVFISLYSLIERGFDERITTADGVNVT